MKNLLENTCFNIDNLKKDLIRFIEVDKNVDGRLNFEEYGAFWAQSVEFFEKEFGFFTTKTEE